MKFSEARKKAKNGDKLYLKIMHEIGHETETWITFAEKGEFALTWEQYDSDQWEIIPAGPKVLTVEEILDNYLLKSQMAGGEDRQYNDDDAIRIIMNSHKNGRLERDLEWVKAVEEIWNESVVMSKPAFYELLLKNLKNLNP